MIDVCRRLDDLKEYFEIIKSDCAVEYYSDGGGDGLDGVSAGGVKNDTLAFYTNFKNFNFEKIFNILEFLWIRQSVYLENKFNMNFLLLKEGCEPKHLTEMDIQNLLKMEIEDHPLETEEQIKKLLTNNKIFFQDRMMWVVESRHSLLGDNEEIETLYQFRRRLGIRICDKNVMHRGKGRITHNG